MTFRKRGWCLDTEERHGDVEQLGRITLGLYAVRDCGRTKNDMVAAHVHQVDSPSGCIELLSSFHFMGLGK